MLKQQVMKLVGVAILGATMVGCGTTNMGPNMAQRGYTGMQAAGAVTGVKRALFVGINKYQHVNGLSGCVNDIDDMTARVTTKDGFSAANITRLTDGQATREGILAALKKIVAESNTGDYIYFHYSGHGAQVPDTNGDEPDRQDEILCPVDTQIVGSGVKNIIVDDEIQSIFGTMKPGVGLLFVSDSCHSGSVDQGLGGKTHARGITLPRNVKNLGSFFADLKAMFNFKKAVDAKKYTLLSGCRDDQTSADAFINGRYNGALTYCYLKALNEGGSSQSYEQLFKGTMDGIMAGHYDQRPVLTGASKIPVFSIAE